MAEEVSCRMYEQEFPSVNDVVVVRVDRITDIAAYVSLLEYNNREGVILLSNLTRVRIKSVSQHIKIGRQEALQVLQIDMDRGYIDLSKRLLQKDEIDKCFARFNKSKQVHSILHRTSYLTQVPVQQLYEQIGWPLYNQYDHALDGFNQIVSNPDLLDQFELDPMVKEQLLRVLQQRMVIPTFKMQADLELLCPSFQGINGIKAALHAGLDMNTESTPVHIQLLTTPLYAVATITTDSNTGITFLNKVIRTIRREIRRQGGTCQTKVEPRIISNC